MKHILEINDREALRYVISRELKNYGLKVPKEKKSSSNNCVCKVHTQEELCTFGCPLGCLPSISVDDASAHTVPRYLVECVEFLKLHLNLEGLFRKPGSRVRQKELKQIILNTGSVPQDSHCADVASLLKEFFRELPDPLFTHKLQETFLKCGQLEEEWKQKNAILLLVTILPESHFHTLLYLMSFLNDVAAHSENNKMNVRNIALVLTPNLIGLNEKQEKSSTLSEKILRIFMSVIALLIQQANRIGFVSETLAEKINNCANKSWSAVDGGLTSEDDLDCSAEAILDAEKVIKKKRRRSGSLQVLTPSRNHQGVYETPKIMRSKRKASEDSGAFTSAKRWALVSFEF
ncbi:rho GTPase-activating protein 11A-like [Antedon mediterranea]|uniref:rho GTPase-activating protein 11A-like n=1 Tax=Antedon mediterranea TaxID=105859 RepID=UPI003AF49E3B